MSKFRAEHLGPQRRRPQVLDVALEIIAESGVANVTMGAIAARLGVTRPVVYDCFPGRGEVLSALLEREQETVLAGIAAMLPPPKTSTVEQMFTDGFAALLTVVSQRPAAWRIIFAHDNDPVLADAIVRGRVQIAQQVGAVMDPLFKRWEVGDSDRTGPVLVEIFLGVCESAIRLFLSADTVWTPEALAEIVGPAAYRALRAKQ